MKIKELRELISTLYDTDDVNIQMSIGCCGDSKDLTIIDAEVEHLTESKIWPHEHFLRVTVGPVSGYRSCIQSGSTEKNDAEYWAKRNKFNDDNPHSLALKEKKCEDTE